MKNLLRGQLGVTKAETVNLNSQNFLYEFFNAFFFLKFPFKKYLHEHI